MSNKVGDIIYVSSYAVGGIKSLFRHMTEEAFLNDVCPVGQMMYPYGV